MKTILLNQLDILKSHIKRSKLRIGLLGLTYEIDLQNLTNKEQLDKRIKKLENIRMDLIDAADAVKELEIESNKNLLSLKNLKSQVDELKKDKDTNETLLKISSESLMRVISQATKKSRIRSIIIGFILGFFASLLANYITNYI